MAATLSPLSLLSSFADIIHTVIEQFPMGVLIWSDHLWLLSKLLLSYFSFDLSKAVESPEATSFAAIHV